MARDILNHSSALGWAPLPCPLCDGKRNIIVMACIECWMRTQVSGEDDLHLFSDEEITKLALFERCAPMDANHRNAFESLKPRTNLP